MKTFSTFLALCAGNSPVTGECCITTSSKQNVKVLVLTDKHISLKVSIKPLIELIFYVETLNPLKKVCVEHGWVITSARKNYTWLLVHTLTQTAVEDKTKRNSHISTLKYILKRSSAKCSPQFCSHPNVHIEGILPKGSYPPCLRMADRALLAGYPRYVPHCDLLTVARLGHHWINRYIACACSLPRHCLNQQWRINNWTLETNISTIWIKDFNSTKYIRKCLLQIVDHVIHIPTYIIHIPPKPFAVFDKPYILPP